MEEWRDWAGRLPTDMVECISRRLPDPKDFMSFRAVCPQWRNTINVDSHGPFHPWIVKSNEVGVDGNVVFCCLNSDKCLEIHVPALKGRRTRLVGFGAGHLIAVDGDDELSAVLVNPLSNESSTLPRLPEWFHGGFTNGFATDPKMTGEDDVFVVIYRWWPHEPDNMAAMWRCGSDAGWSTIPFGRFWPAMPRLRSRLAEHGPGVMEEELAAAADGMEWPLDAQGAHLIEHEGKVRLLFRHEDHRLPFPSQVFFTLHDIVGENLALVDWADAPELHDKIILQSWHINPCYVLPARDDFTGLSSKNCIYFFSWQYLDEGNASQYCLCKWDLLERVSIVVKKMPSVWEWGHGRWFCPLSSSSSCYRLLRARSIL